MTFDELNKCGHELEYEEYLLVCADCFCKWVDGKFVKTDEGGNIIQPVNTH